MAKVTGEGTIVQLEKDKPRGKCRKWQLRVPVGLDPRSGKYKTRTRRFTGTYTEAKKALRDFIAEIEGDRVAKRAGTTMAECAEEFLRRREESGELAANTIQNNRAQLKAAMRHIGHIDASKVTHEVLEDMYAAMRRGDTATGSPAGGSYLRAVHRTLSLLFDHLVKAGAILSNPCKEAETPSRDTPERRAIKPESIAGLVRQLDVEQEPDFAFFLAVTMGLRRGEVCGLSWGDVDLADGILTVRHSYDHFGNLKETKTKAGMRWLPMSDAVKTAFARHRDAQRERLASCPAEKGGPRRQTDDTPVILNPTTMERANPDRMAYWWRRDRVGLDLDGWCLHELRHSYLTMLALEGVHPKVMQELAGHASSQITMEVYTHVNMKAKAKAASIVERALGGMGMAEERPAFTAIEGGKAADPSCKHRAQPPARFVPNSYQPTPVEAQSQNPDPLELALC